MNQTNVIKADDASSAPDLRKVKYSWLEDACIWFQYTNRMTQPRAGDEVLSGRSASSIGIRLYALHSIEREIKFKKADLSDQENIGIWSAFIAHKFQAESSVSRGVPTVHKKSVVALSKLLNLPFDALQSRLELIRNTKHFLYISGIHFEEGDTLTEYEVTRPTKLTSNQLPQRAIVETKTIVPRKRDDYTLPELQALYRFKYGTDQTNTIDDLAKNLNISISNAKSCLTNITERSTEAERIVKEGVTLLCGEDTDLWHDYIDKHVIGPVHPVEISLSTAVSAAVATEKSLKPMFTHFRLHLVRNLKKYLYIAGIHDDQDCSCELPTEIFSSGAPETMTAQASFASSAIIDTIDWIISCVEKNNLLCAIDTGELTNTVCAEPQSERVQVTTVPGSETRSPLQNQSIQSDDDPLNSKPVSALSTAASEDPIDRMTTVLESEATVDIQQETSSGTHGGHDVDSTTVPVSEDIAITKTSLRSRASLLTATKSTRPAATARISTTTTTTTTTTSTSTKRPVPNLASAKSAPVGTGVGKPYTMHDDRMIWQAWLTTNGFAIANSGLEVKTSLGTELKRNQNGIDRRVDKLLIVREEANQAVQDGFTLLPNCKELRLWHAYCALCPPLCSDNSVYINVPSAAKLAEGEGLLSVIDDLQAIRSIKWFLNISGIHEEVATTDLPTASIQLPLGGPTTSSISLKHSKAKASHTPNTKEHERLVGQCSAEMATEKPVLAVFPELQAAAKTTTESNANTTASVLVGIDLHDTTPSLNLLISPFAFSLQHDADIWRAYLKSQLPTSHKLLPSRLQKLTCKIGCTFAQAKERLSELINLNIGLTVQCHSSGRPFTEAEDAIIMTELSKGGSMASGNRLGEVAVQLRCSVGAVAVHSRQLKTLRLLDEVNSHIHTQQDKSAVTQASSVSLPPHYFATSPPDTSTPYPVQSSDKHNCEHVAQSTLLGKRSSIATDISTSNKVTKFDTDHGSKNADDETIEPSAHFSTEGEESENVE